MLRQFLLRLYSLSLSLSFLVTCRSLASPLAFVPWYHHMKSKQSICIMCSLTEQDVAERHESQRQTFRSRFLHTVQPSSAFCDSLKPGECVFACLVMMGIFLDPGGSSHFSLSTRPLVASNALISAGYFTLNHNTVKSCIRHVMTLIVFLIKDWITTNNSLIRSPDQTQHIGWVYPCGVTCPGNFSCNCPNKRCSKHRK